MIEAKPRRSARLRPAFLWICDDCGRDNFERPVAAGEIDPEQVPDSPGWNPDELRELIAAVSEAGSGWISIPDEVACIHCGGAFRAACASAPGSD